MAPIINLLLIREGNEQSAAYLAQDNSRNILAITGFWCFLSLSVVALRAYVRAAMVKFFGWDDIAILVTSALGLGIWVCFVGEAQYGLGRHIAALNESDAEMLLLWQFPHGLLSLLGNMLVKISVALLLIRVTGGVVYRKFLYGIIAVVTIYSLFCVGTSIGSCNVISANWKLNTMQHAKCLSHKLWNGIGITYSVLNMVTNTVLALLPIPIVFKLQLDLRTKIAICMVLSLGFVAVACGMVKTHYYFDLARSPDHVYRDNYMIWAALELYTGIVAASLPTLRPLMVAAMGKARITLANTPAYPEPDQTASHAEPEILLSPISLKSIAECDESKTSFEDDSKNNDTIPRLDSLASHKRSSVSSLGKSKINTTTLNLDSVTSPTPVILGKPPVKPKANMPHPDTLASPARLSVSSASSVSSSGKSKINTTTLHFDALASHTPVIFSRPPVRPKRNMRDLRSFHDGVTGDPNYEQMTFCTRSRSIVAPSASAPKWTTSPISPAFSLPASPMRHLFPADLHMRQSLSPRSHMHRRVTSNTSNVITQTTDSAIVVTKKVITSTESMPASPAIWASSPVSTLSFVGPYSPSWVDGSLPPTPASPIKRTLDKVFRKHHGIAGDTVYEDDAFGNSHMDLDWEKLVTPMVHGCEGMDLDWDALDAPMDYGSALLRVPTEMHGLSEKGSEAELVVRETQDE